MKNQILPESIRHVGYTQEEESEGNLNFTNNFTSPLQTSPARNNIFTNTKMHLKLSPVYKNEQENPDALIVQGSNDGHDDEDGDGGGENNLMSKSNLNPINKLKSFVRNQNRSRGIIQAFTKKPAAKEELGGGQAKEGEDESSNILASGFKKQHLTLLSSIISSEEKQGTKKLLLKPEYGSQSTKKPMASSENQIQELKGQLQSSLPTLSAQQQQQQQQPSELPKAKVEEDHLKFEAERNAVPKLPKKASQPKVYCLEQTFEKLQQLFDSERERAIEQRQFQMESSTNRNQVNSYPTMLDELKLNEKGWVQVPEQKQGTSKRATAENDSVDPPSSQFLKRLQHGNLGVARESPKECMKYREKHSRQLQQILVDFCPLMCQDYPNKVKSIQTFDDIERREGSNSKKFVINTAKPNMQVLQKSVKSQADDFLKTLFKVSRSKDHSSNNALVSEPSSESNLHKKTEENYYYPRNQSKTIHQKFRTKGSPTPPPPPSSIAILRNSLIFSPRQSTKPFSLLTSSPLAKKPTLSNIRSSMQLDHSVSLKQDKYLFKKGINNSISPTPHKKLGQMNLSEIQPNHATVTPFLSHRTPRKYGNPQEGHFLNTTQDISKIHLADISTFENDNQNTTFSSKAIKNSSTRSFRRDDSSQVTQQRGRDSKIRRNFIEAEWPHQDENIGDSSFHSFTETQLDSYYTRSQAIQKHINADQNPLRAIKGLLKLEFLYKQENKDKNVQSLSDLSSKLNQNQPYNHLLFLIENLTNLVKQRQALIKPTKSNERELEMVCLTIEK